MRAAIASRSLVPPEPAWPDAWPWPLRLRVLGAFEWTAIAATGGEGSRTAIKPLELLRRLAAEGGLDPLPAETLAEGLWPGEGREGRDKALETTLARLRRLLGDPAAVRLAERRLRLDPQRVWLDRAALERLLQRIDAAAASGRGADDDTTLAALWHEALSLWRGPLLADLGDDAEAPPWLQVSRTRLRQRLAASLLGCADRAGHESRRLRALAADRGLGPWLGPPA
ncbi:MAG: hypothetical protein Fur0014_17630 [Rubrivivax sp.]